MAETATATPARTAAAATTTVPAQKSLSLSQRNNAFVKMLDDSKDLSNALPTTLGLSAERFNRILLTTLNKNPKLIECTMTSLGLAVMTAAGLGLTLDPSLGLAYLVPFNTRKGSDWVSECQLIIGYRGYIELAYRSSKIEFLDAFCVYANEINRVSAGANPTIEHEPMMVGDRGKFIYAYAVAHIKGASRPKFTTMRVEDINVIMEASQSVKSVRAGKAKDSPWLSSYEEMAKKTVIRRLMKMLPLSPELADALTKDQDQDTRFENAKDVTPPADNRPLFTNQRTAAGSEQAAESTYPLKESKPTGEATIVSLLAAADKAGISQADLEEWCTGHGRIAKDGTLDDLSPEQTADIIEHLHLVASDIRGE